MPGSEEQTSSGHSMVPLWVLLLCLLLGFVLLIAFSWAVKTAAHDYTRAGSFSKLAYGLASFPDLTQEVVDDLRDYAKGEHAEQAVYVARPDKDLSGFEPVPQAQGIDVRGLLMRADKARLTPGWRLLAGGFVVNGTVENAVLLLSPELKIVNVWVVDEIPVDGLTPRPNNRKFVHGLALLDDRSIVFTFHGAVSLQRFDRCGHRLWTVGGDYNHSVALDDERKSVWTLRGISEIVKVAVADGKVLRRITIPEIVAANPDIDILGIRQERPDFVNSNPRNNTSARWLFDPFHINDVEPLPAAFADRFPDFEAGDLLVSVRNLNLLFVLDPKTLKVKWWRTGATSRQHDADWQPDGTITVLDNRMGRDYSQILSIDPSTYRTKARFDGRKNNFYTRIRGKHQITPDGDILVASSQEGRAFEVSPDGDVVLEFVNTKPGSTTRNYTITDFIWAPLDAIKAEEDTCKSS